MGLDQRAYTVSDDGTELDIAQWRKHPNLQGWMEAKWESKGRPVVEGNVPNSEFNCVVLELTADDIDELEFDVQGNLLPHTTGFFFGESQTEDAEIDMLFIERARGNFKLGNKVFYDSWW